MAGPGAGARAADSGARSRDDRAAGRRAGVAAFVVPPVAWLLALALSYAGEDFTCAAAATADATAPESGLKITLLVLNAVLLVVTLLAGLLGWRAARRPGDQGGRSDVARFTGYVGAGLAVVFAFGIVLIAWNVFVLEVCG